MTAQTTAPPSLEKQTRGGAGSSSRTARSARIRSTLRGLAGAAVLVIAFQLVSVAGIVNSAFLPPFFSVFGEMIVSLGRPDVWIAIGSTLIAWFLGMLISIVIAVPLGILFGLSTVSYRASRAIIELIRPMPAVALIPLALLAIGPGLQMKLAIAVFAAVWPILFNTIYGVHGVDIRAIDMGRTFGLSRWQVIRRIIIPSASPLIFTGIRLSSAIVLIVIITVELIAGGSLGLGSFIATNQAAGDRVPLVYAGILIAGVLGLLINLLLGRIERRAFAWNAREGLTS